MSLMTNALSLDEYTALLAASMPERGRNGLQERVRRLVDRLRSTGLEIERYHTFDSRRSGAGFPDEIIVLPHTGRLIVAELKSEKGRVTKEQQRWLDAFATIAGAEVHVWRPQHLLSGEIEKTLKGGTR